jgi:hypothetical protein
MTLFLTTQFAMANGGPSFDQLYQASHQGKPVIKLIDQSSNKKQKQFCLTSIAQNKVKEKAC